MDSIQEFFFKATERGLSPQRIFAALMSSFFLSYTVQLVSYGGFGSLNDYYNSIKFADFFIIAILAFVIMIVATFLTAQRLIIPWALMASAVSVSVLFAVNYSGDSAAYFALGLALVDLIVVIWEVRGDKLGISKISISRKTALIAAAVLFVVTTAVFGYLTSLKYRAYSDFTFDFGIFAQMYERMASTGIPYTTVERSHMMSHFGVHFSPIFYLFLPGYYIFRSPVYLFYVQSAAVAAGVFAIWLIAGKMNMTGKTTLAFELIYAFYPCLINGTFYDFHENKFLTTIILFLFYFIISGRYIWTMGFSLLLLSVKEDAAVYLIVIALYVMIHRKELFRGLSMLVLAIVYFIIAQNIVAATGTEGVMMYRLSDYFINGEQSFGSVFKAIFFDAGYLLQQVFSADKIPFLVWMFIPVMLAPFMTRKIASLILLLPILPINLMQSWQYQYNVDYQYTYGVAAMVLICAITAVIRMDDQNRRRVIILASVCACIVMSTALVAPKVRNVSSYMKYTEGSRTQVDELLAEVPSDATVTASHSLVPHLYKVEWLYTMPDYYSAMRDKPVDTEYFVIDTRYSELANDMHEVMGDSYTLIKSAGFAELYRHN